MTELFLKLVNMSISASWLILAVLVLRLLLQKAPKAVRCVLWCLVGVKLIFPFSIESALSLIPSTEVITHDTMYAVKPTIDSGIDAVNQAVNPILAENFAPNPGDSVNPLQVLATVAAFVWIIGVAVLVCYTLFSFLRLKGKVGEAVRLRENIYQSEAVASPFIVGVVKPHIYVPFSLKEEELMCVLAHEKAHIKRGDHLWKPLGFLILAVYWFNPLIWFAYVLLCRDIELACDEKVMQQIGTDKKKLYSEALLNCSISHKMNAACPLAFGEVGVKQRIKNVLSYKKPTFWIVLVSILACVVCAVCFMTEPKVENKESDTQNEVVSAGVDSEMPGTATEWNESNVGQNVGQFAVEEEILSDGWENKNILQSPPTLLLQDSLSSSLNYYEVNTGTYSWQYQDGDMMTGVEASGAAPQIAVKGVEWLQLVSYNKLDYVPYTLHFAMVPNRITVREYDLLELGDMDAEVISETVYEDVFVSIPLKERRIYEVVAEWNDSNLENYGCYGTAYYAFATDNYIKYEEATERITLEAHVKEILVDMDNAILISSDTDSFPGAFVVVVPPEVCAMENLSGGDSLVVTMKETGERFNKLSVYEAVELSVNGEVAQSIPLGNKFTEEVNNFEGVTMTMEKYKATEGAVEIYNGRDNEIQYGDYYDIQV